MATLDMSKECERVFALHIELSGDASETSRERWFTGVLFAKAETGKLLLYEALEAKETDSTAAFIRMCYSELYQRTETEWHTKSETLPTILHELVHYGGNDALFFFKFVLRNRPMVSMKSICQGDSATRSVLQMINSLGNETFTAALWEIYKLHIDIDSEHMDMLNKFIESCDIRTENAVISAYNYGMTMGAIKDHTCAMRCDNCTKQKFMKTTFIWSITHDSRTVFSLLPNVLPFPNEKLLELMCKHGAWQCYDYSDVGTRSTDTTIFAAIVRHDAVTMLPIFCKKNPKFFQYLYFYYANMGQMTPFMCCIAEKAISCAKYLRAHNLWDGRSSLGARPIDIATQMNVSEELRALCCIDVDQIISEEIGRKRKERG